MIAEYAAEQNYTEETAAEYLTIAKQGRSRAPFYSTIHDDDRPGKIRINVREKMKLTFSNLQTAMIGIRLFLQRWQSGKF